MSTKKKILAFAIMILILATTLVGLLWHMRHYEMIGLEFYPKDLQTLDLRGQEISISHYQKFHRRLPQCEILWDVPLESGRYPHDSTVLTLPHPSAEDVEHLSLFPRLKALDARGCEDYELLQTVQEAYPELEVFYTVSVSGETYDQDTRQITVDGLSTEDVERMAYLPELARVRLESGQNPAQVVALLNACRMRNIPVTVSIGGEDRELSVTELTVEGITDRELSLLQFLPHLEQITLQQPQVSIQSLLQLTQELPNVSFRWEKTVLGLTFGSDATVLDLTAGVSQEGARAYELSRKAPVQGTRDEIPYQFAVDDDYPLPDMTEQTDQLIREVEEALPWFPNAEEVILCGAVLDNEAMAQFRERSRESCKVIWSVQCGNKMIVRTDSPYLMPTKYHVYYFLDKDAVNLKYCEDMMCIDLGHMAISNIDFVTNMPNLTYLVLAHTQLQYIEPIRTCKNLKFLELDWSPLRDYSPLKDCTALEDLNLGETFADFTPVGEMTWLKHLWMVGCSRGPAYRMTEALTETQVMVSGSATVANGWRDLPNYYAMRDAMGMYYMSW